jgi:uncharacterized protein (DUF924 family)
MMDPKAREILDYWFGDLSLTPEYFKTRNRMWFMGGEKVDSHIRQHYGADVVRAVEGGYADWLDSPRGCLALILLLDQFSLNLYREQPRSYQQSELAIPITRRIITRGWEKELTEVERVFVYLPLEHSELLPDQEESVHHFEKLAAGAASPALREAMEDYLEYARRHERVVRKYGRFPDRNEVFGRPNTPEEEAFLASDEAPF